MPIPQASQPIPIYVPQAHTSQSKGLHSHSYTNSKAEKTPAIIRQQRGPPFRSLTKKEPLFYMQGHLRLCTVSITPLHLPITLPSPTHLCAFWGPK
ncbi:uncharacterized protein SETTUDRAFT_164858 [Exserohilum turcica Et28A]|uniref:Uncharacterized protein n=1 Tax=Exserohilum turcicum (strain 28A) TaxID=671987 RepID=R0K1I4_EXST2|nr:uncharacterized protein SETTUDRAFT_164858 [Exserohilum turcica Et28A]EOA83519.1 hypothetical protein SETTUDRAFT_164858 [Exserohilum turcica Et28A]